MSGPGRAARVQAPAKVNLALRILERQPDGYHEVETLFQAIDLCDTVEIRVGGGGPVTLRVIGAAVGRHEDNLVMRAAEAFLAEARIREGLAITLTKRIPAGAGLGGGSSDAGATLRLLAHLFPESAAAARLPEIGAGLGSDVPFFTQAHGWGVGRGRGERFEPLAALPTRWLVVGLPPIHQSTPEAYRQLAQERADGGGAVPARLFGSASRPPADWAEVAALAVNDFERGAVRVHPEIGRALAALRVRQPALALLSGSGAAVFAVYGDREAAEAARTAAAAACPDAHFVITRTLDQMPGAQLLAP